MILRLSVMKKITYEILMRTLEINEALKKNFRLHFQFLTEIFKEYKT